ncbi:TadE-like protein [Maioricimonas rarisocia]|uniref:TadE-like protein n=1 Tax=Maioricimonas rarisocia TaxID=2528026 RepID=A0A517ZG38_9PLAN|nr:TadE/TadG family type IV pilus assembly protein [Maioricimonas rarisocia]QDU41424.1 TadE-like protein [Maioricimonas rarisocia]
MRSTTRHEESRQQSRSGAATVEFALVAPLFLTLVLGTVEMGTAINAAQTMNAAIREGGRLATMNYEANLAPGQTPNQKVIQDIRNFLTASGIPGDEVTITITHADGASAGSTFDLADPDNYLELFQITATVPYSEVSTFPMNYMSGQTLRAALVFRMARSNLSS